MQIKDLKKILDTKQHAFQRSKLLEAEREALYTELISLKEKRQTFGEKEIDQTLERVKKKVKEIDEELDNLEEDPEFALLQFKQELVAKIQKKSPEASKEWELLEEKKMHQIKRHEELSSLKQSLLPFYRDLKEGMSFKKRRTFFDFLFGKGPKIHLSAAIFNAHVEAKKIQDTLENPLFRKMITEFVNEAEKKWNHTLYTEKIFLFFNKFQAAFEKLEKECEDLEKKMDASEKESENWLEHYCK